MEIFNATRPGGLDGWTMALEQYTLMRDHILTMLEDESDEQGTVLLKDLVDAAQDRFGKNPASPVAACGTICTYTKSTSKLDVAWSASQAPVLNGDGSRPSK